MKPAGSNFLILLRNRISSWTATPALTTSGLASNLSILQEDQFIILNKQPRLPDAAGLKKPLFFLPRLNDGSRLSVKTKYLSLHSLGKTLLKALRLSITTFLP